MRVDDLQQLYDYNYWANDKLLAVVAQLTPEQFTQPVAGSYESVRNTLVHILSAEWGWLDRCGGAKRGEKLVPENYPTVQAIRDQWKQVEEYMREFLSTLRNDDVERPIEFAIGSGPKQTMPLAVLLQHGAIHAVHHRGQVALLLRVLGYAPGNLDLVIYAAEKRLLPHLSS